MESLIKINRNKGIITQLSRIASALERQNELKELELQTAHGITTRIVSASKEDLDETRVSYTEPRFESMLIEVERRTGRKLNDDEAAILISVLQEDREEE